MSDDGRAAIGELIAGMRRQLEAMTAASDPKRFFHGTYLRTTITVAADIDAGGFLDAGWMRRWDVVFAGYYLDALDRDRAGAPVPGPWRVAFRAAGGPPGRPALEPVRHVLLGMNAHINYDLPQALLQVITPDEFDDPGVLAARHRDHERLDRVLHEQIDAEDVALRAVSRVRLIDRMMRPANQAATRRLLAESRAKVWDNAIVLNRARRDGAAAYRAALDRLERLCQDRVARLTTPGPVLITLATRGFGVRLAGHRDNARAAASGLGDSD